MTKSEFEEYEALYHTRMEEAQSREEMLLIIDRYEQIFTPILEEEKQIWHNQVQAMFEHFKHQRQVLM